MGSSSSRLTAKRSTKSDALPNVQWSLYQLVLWKKKHEACGYVSYPSGSSEVAQGAVAPAGSMPEEKSPTNAEAEQFQQWQQTSAPDTIAEDYGMSSKEFEAYGDLPNDDDELTVESDAEWAAMSAADNKVLRDKYGFLLGHIEKLIRFAEENYMLAAERSLLKDQRKHSDSSYKSQWDMKLADNNTLLLKRLGDFDNVRDAVQWVIKHYELLQLRRENAIEIHDCTARIIAIRSDPSDAARSEVKKLRGRLTTAYKARARAMKSARSLRRESLEIGLKYLDTNNVGYLEPGQSRLHADLFARLDRSNHKKISNADLQKSITKTENDIDDANKRIETDYKSLQNDRSSKSSGREDIDKKRGDLNKLVRERNRNVMALREISAIFHEAFIEALFNELGYPRSRMDIRAVGEDLAHVENNMLQHEHIAQDAPAVVPPAMAPAAIPPPMPSSAYAADQRQFVPSQPMMGQGMPMQGTPAQMYTVIPTLMSGPGSAPMMMPMPMQQQMPMQQMPMAQRPMASMSAPMMSTGVTNTVSAPPVRLAPEILPTKVVQNEPLPAEVHRSNAYVTTRVIQPVEREIINPVETVVKQPVIEEQQRINTTVVQPVVNTTVREQQTTVVQPEQITRNLDTVQKKVTNPVQQGQTQMVGNTQLPTKVLPPINTTTTGGHV